MVRASDHLTDTNHNNDVVFNEISQIAIAMHNAKIAKKCSYVCKIAHYRNHKNVFLVVMFFLVWLVRNFKMVSVLISHCCTIFLGHLGINIEIQISISERSSGWAINYYIVG